MVRDIKLIFTGTMGAGKTTAIRSISDRDPVNTDVRATDDTAERKDSTTVAMDYGELRLEDDTVLHLYGTPGQERFRHMWQVLVTGGLGLIILVDNARPDPLADLVIYLDNFAEFIRQTAAVIGVTRMDLAPQPDLAAYGDLLKRRQEACPLFGVDARERKDVIMLVEALLSQLEYK